MCRDKCLYPTETEYSAHVDVYKRQEHPYRTKEYAGRLLSHGSIALKGMSGDVAFRNLNMTRLKKDAVNEADTMPRIDEQNDAVILSLIHI